ncbi:protein Z-dependent protease inhibitor [Austrofundulus limnaeus]|uniref:Protein Z-dependent protease inhibitor-like n=1 Tax=Austrofundulus limnaeus TaxID=52670 RepID=A0A2I4CDP4_AUSLI|nr:PREDICTED: protein Z-dependent protease inhibitor-like [Austrofundulus limnaeus]XP_013878117.1 PREDICTED: protein Z-dependent protease inhibitor-like [Austrofundulus limnaeus]
MAPTILLLSLLVHLLSPAQSIDPAVEDLINKNADFGARLYRAVASRTDSNVVLSPFSLSAGMLALLSATNGPTRDQLLQGLTLTGLDPETIPDQFQTLKNLVLPGQLSSNLQTAMAVFPSQNLQVSESYQQLVQTKFDGVVQSLSYNVPSEAVGTINRWVQDQMGDEFQDLLSTMDPQTQLLIATAARLQTQFDPPFNSSFTQDERFYVDRYHVVMVPMMFRADKYFLAYDGLVKAGVLKLPMADGAAMLVVLPDDGVDLTTVEEEVTFEKIQTWIQQLKKTKLEVQLPRFLLERSYTLKDVLQTLDIVTVFQDDADISNMGEIRGAKLSQVHHKSVVTVNENLADVSISGSRLFSTPPPRLTFNRPFVFIIYQEATRGLLFMGRVTNPTEK